MKTLKDYLLALLAISLALVLSFCVGIYQYPDNEILRQLSTNRTLICIFYAVWMLRTTGK